MTLEEVIGLIHPLTGIRETELRAPIGRVTTDSREAEPGGIFVALPGERAHGAEFAGEAFRRGARAVIAGEDGVGRIPDETLRRGPVLVVKDPVEALGDVARAHRQRHRRIPLVAITGSSGKTSTKEMLFGLLSRSLGVLRNPGNRNNLIGMPLALLELSEEHDVAVMEMGTNRPGEIARLAEIAAPDIGVVTNVAPAHLLGLLTLEGVAREKGDLFRALPEGGTAVVNATDLRVVREAGRCRARKIFYGAALNEVSGRILAMGDSGMRIAIRTPAGEYSSDLPVTGEHNLMNALAAAAASIALGLPPASLEGGFASCGSAPGRFRTVPLRCGGLLIDDSYNANPASTEAAIRNLSALRRGRRAVVVFADMLELGEASPSSHLRIGRLFGRAGVDRLIAFGADAAQAARGAVDAGMDAGRVSHAGDREALRALVRGALAEGDVVLVKGSRGMRLEEIARDIEEAWS